MGIQSELFLLAMIRETDMVAYLDSLGYQPATIKKNGTDYWYLSPLRNEAEPSFHVNRATNEWYDFPLASGGNMIDFCLRYHQVSVSELLLNYNADFSFRRLPGFDPKLYGPQVPRVSNLVVKEVRNLYAYPLKNYLHERSIPVGVADLFCKEVSYEISGRTYYGIGFKNDAGGWELRNKNFKQSSSPKDISTLRFGAPSVQVFEGFMDFLSYRALHPYQEPGANDFVVLNGAGLFERAVGFLDGHEQVGLWLDRDVTGVAYTNYALSLGEKYKDESGRYSRHKDLNDWLMHKGEVQKLAVKPGFRRRPVG